MVKTTMRTSRIFAFALLATSSAVALADPPSWHDQRRDDRNYRDDRSGSEKRAVRDMVGEVEHNYRGHVVDVQPPAANEDLYRVRVLQEGGRVKTLRVPAKRDHDRGRD